MLLSALTVQGPTLNDVENTKANSNSVSSYLEVRGQTWNIFLISCIFPITLKRKVKWTSSFSLVSNSLQPQGLYSPWNSLGQNTGAGILSLFQGIFPTQGSNTGLLHCRQILYRLSHQGNPRILEWVTYPFSRSPQPGNWTKVFCIAGRFFASWAIRETPLIITPLRVINLILI